MSRRSRARRAATRKRRIRVRLRDRRWKDQPEPVLTAGNIHYDVADRTRAFGVGGIGAIHLLVQRTGLAEAIDERLGLLKVHVPYHESDHVLNVGYTILCGGTCLEHIELWRNDEVVLSANGRCNQENLLAQLLGGAPALRAPVDTLLSNWAYRVMASLAWTLKAWLALSMPERGRWGERYRQEKRTVLRMEFKTFLNALMRVPCQIVRTGRRIVYRLLGWNPWQAALLRVADALRQPMRC